MLPSARSAAFYKGDWAAVGRFPADLSHGEDLVFFRRMASTFGQPTWCTRSYVTWNGRSSLSDFFRQYRNYARGDAFAHMYRGRHALRIIIYVFFFVALARRNGRDCGIASCSRDVEASASPCCHGSHIQWRVDVKLRYLAHVPFLSIAQMVGDAGKFVDI